MNNLKHQKGYTLIEIMIASVLFAIVLSGFIGAVSSLGISQYKSRVRSQAIQYAREGVEVGYNLSLQNWDQVHSFNGEFGLEQTSKNESQPFPFFKLNQNSPEALNDGRYQRTLMFEPAFRDKDTGKIIDDPTDPNAYQDNFTRKLTVTVTWQLSGQTLETSLTTFLMNFANLFG
jgi:prepilin-type N-terminal cleavage/methylation domain-containing protein